MLTPDQIANASNTEHAHQAAAFQWVAVVGAKLHPQMHYIFAVPNGADYGGKSQTGARMRAEGLKPGVPDMMWPWGPERKFYVVANKPVYPQKGLWVELKRPGAHGKKNGDRGDKQVEWHLWLRSQGWHVVTAYGWKCAAWAFLEHAEGRLTMLDEDCLFVHSVDTARVEGMVP